VIASALLARKQNRLGIERDIRVRRGRETLDQRFSVALMHQE
jgi:hypothetical protein